MAFWRFFDYITDEHINPIGNWYAKQNDDARVAFDNLLKALSETEDWDEPKPKKRKYKLLTNKHQGLCELKFNLAEKRFGMPQKYRVIGVWLRETHEFILLGACHKWRLFTVPLDAFDWALRLKKDFDLGRGGLHEHF